MFTRRECNIFSFGIESNYVEKQKMKKRKHNIIPQMFDVRPQEIAGDFDIEKINKKYSRLVKLRKEALPNLNKKRPSIIMPAKWDMSRNNFSTETEGGFRVSETRNLEILSRQAREKKVFQLNQPNLKKEIPSFISVEREKFLGASKPFLNQSFDYKQEIFEKEKITQRESKISLSQKFQEWQKEKQKERQRQEKRLQRRQEKKEAILKEKLIELEKVRRMEDELRMVKLAEKLRSEEEAAKQKKLEKIALAKRRVLRNKKIKKLFSSINPFGFSLKNILESENIIFNKKRQAFSFVMASMILFCGFWGIKIFSYGIQIQDDVIVKGQNAVGELAFAKDDLENQDFVGAVRKFSNARDDFQEASGQLDYLGGDLLNVFSAIPGLSKASSGKSIIKAGEKMTEAAEELGALALVFVGENNKSNQFDAHGLKEVFVESNERLVRAHSALEEAQSELDRVKEKDLPEEYRQKFLQIKEILPSVVGLLDDLEKNYEVLWEIFGFSGVRRYLFVFQNNQEMRATGGFIGSYGVLEMNDGKVKNLFIDGIYNPDGQLREKVVPPKPIQKISAAWSTHDANWFPDFPTSAEKIAWFYEKTGGPTVDGVIAVTPTVMQKLLEITGPIEMPEYETTIDAENFIEKTQYEVEVDYDKEENEPKKFLADLAPKVLENLFVDKGMSRLSKAFRVFSESLKEKHILIYSFNYEAQKVISEQGWSGEILQTGKDYLMVVNTNINGYKTDGVIDETINHKAEIQSDGTIINTVKIVRHHKGGDYEHEWWNKVNSDYMRVYVPKGSQFLSVEGHTREFNNPPLDYDKLEFRRDAQVESEEQSMKIDEATGTRIYEEDNKTVFANWVYVSPKETVEIEYKYILPFRIDLSKNRDNMDSYSLLVQKQSGSIGSDLSSKIIFPSDSEIFWKYPETLSFEGGELNFKQVLKSDLFWGVVLKKKE